MPGVFSLLGIFHHKKPLLIEDTKDCMDFLLGGEHVILTSWPEPAHCLRISKIHASPNFHGIINV